MSANIAGVKIRRLKTWEIPELLRFQEENDYKSLSVNKHEPQSIFFSFLKALWHHKRLAVFVADNGREIVGYISLVFGKSRKFRGNAYILGAAVKDSERGKGIGTLLFNHLERYAVGRGARRIEFEVFSKNTQALKLYERLGYNVEGVKRRAVEQAGEYDDLVMLAKFTG